MLGLYVFVADPTNAVHFVVRTESLTGFGMMNDEEMAKTVLCQALPAWSVRYAISLSGSGRSGASR